MESLSGGVGWESVTAIDAGASGAIAVTGFTNSTKGFDGQKFNGGDSDIFVTLINSDGNKRWTRIIGNGTEEYVRGLAVGSNDEVYIVGTQSRGQVGFIKKLSANGDVLWGKAIDFENGDSVNGVSLGEPNSVYITGFAQGNRATDGNIVIAKYSTSGDQIWLKSAGTLLPDLGFAIAADLQGSFYVAGSTAGDLDAQKNRSLSSDAFLSKYTNDGSLEWTVLAGESTRASGRMLAIGVDGSIYLAGFSLINSRELLLLARYSSDGVLIWKKAYELQSTLETARLTSSPTGGVYLVDKLRVIRINKNGDREWARSFDTDGTISAITVSPSGEGLIAGETESANFLSQSSNASYDAFIASITLPPPNKGDAVASDIEANGLYQEGVTLFAPMVSGDPDGGASNPDYAYQWHKDGEPILNSSESTFVTSATGYGTYKVAITYSDFKDFRVTISSPEQAVAKINNGTGTAGVIAGNGPFNEGVILTAGAITGDPDGNGAPTAYQWFLDNTAIAGATSSTYTTTSTGAGTYKVAITYTDNQAFTATVDSREQIVAKFINMPTTKEGTAIIVNNLAYPETIAALNGSPDLLQVQAAVKVTVNAFCTETWATRYVAHNVGSTLQSVTGQKINLNGLGKYSFIATSIPDATSRIVLEQNKNTAFFLHDAYGAFYEGVALTIDFTKRQSAARVLDVDVIEMGSAGGISIVDLTSKDYVTGAVTVYGANQGRSIFWGTDADDAFVSGGGDSAIFGGGGFNQAQLGNGKDVLQFRNGVTSRNRIEGFDPSKDMI